MERIWKTLILICAIFLASAMIVSPIEATSAARNAIGLCYEVVIPSLFPFFICSSLFIALGGAEIAGRYLSVIMRPLFKIPGDGAVALVLGIISGYPIGASCAVKLYKSGSCNRTEAERLLAFCNNSGPIFIIAAVGAGMLESKQLGIALYVIHLVSALLTGIIFRYYGKNTIDGVLALPPSIDIKSAAASIGEAVADSVESILKICGFVILFSVFTSVLPDNIIGVITYPFLEITGGINNFIHSTKMSSLTLPAISFFVALSGVSVLLQVSAIVIPGGLSVKPYVLGKIIQAVLAFILTYVVFGI